MITLPKPKYIETNVPIGKSKEDYKEEISAKQTHQLNNAIDRVSFRGRSDLSNVFFLNINFLKHTLSLFIHPQLIQLVF